MMKNVLITLAPIEPQVLFITDPKEHDFQREVVDKLKQHAAELGLTKILNHPISTFSGGAAEQASDYSVVPEESHDVMACMPGYHILPDGKIAFQAYDTIEDIKTTHGYNKDGNKIVTYGSRPEIKEGLVLFSEE